MKVLEPQSFFSGLMFAPTVILAELFLAMIVLFWKFAMPQSCVKIWE